MTKTYRFFNQDPHQLQCCPVFTITCFLIGPNSRGAMIIKNRLFFFCHDGYRIQVLPVFFECFSHSQYSPSGRGITEDVKNDF